jgi:asparagine synthase (glutamine-hydrolysing)
MCGIAGFAYKTAARDPGTTVRRMIAAQKHRGPDGQSFYSAPGASLGHCRLAILDLSSAGLQPMCNPTQRLWITFNGEIYNYIELRNELRRAGHHFRSDSDTEVLLAAYSEWGQGCLHRLRGMFAFAIWDEQERQLFAARDRLGIKPFHYWMDPAQTQFAFASELKALIDFLPERRVDVTLAQEFLAWNLIDQDPARTMLKGLFRLPAAHFLVWDARHGLHVHRYWSFAVSEELHTPDVARATLVSEFRDRLFESVALHLRSDVPVGTCLSGGLDSSSIVCVVRAELLRRGAWRENWQHTFSACFDDPGLDERPYIRCVTSTTDTHNHEVFPSGERLREEMDTWLWHQEEPVGSCAAYAQFCVARLAREHGIKVLLDGQGADEQLAGYRKFILVYLRQLLLASKYGQAAREAVAFFSSTEILRTLRWAEGRRYLFPSAPEQASLWRNSELERPAAVRLGMSVGRRIHEDLTACSLPILLRFEDRNAMAFGVEARVPFVDHVFVEWMGGLAADLRLWHGWTKFILREALADMLPPRVRTRKTKLGFSTPQSKWLRGPLEQWLIHSLSSAQHVGEVVDRTGVTRLLQKYQRNLASSATEALLFRLAVFENWGRLFLESNRAAAS